MAFLRNKMNYPMLVANIFHQASNLIGGTSLTCRNHSLDAAAPQTGCSAGTAGVTGQVTVHCMK